MSARGLKVESGSVPFVIRGVVVDDPLAFGVVGGFKSGILQGARLEVGLHLRVGGRKDSTTGGPIAQKGEGIRPMTGTARFKENYVGDPVALELDIGLLKKIGFPLLLL